MRLSFAIATIMAVLIATTLEICLSGAVTRCNSEYGAHGDVTAAVRAAHPARRVIHATPAPASGTGTRRCSSIPA